MVYVSRSQRIARFLKALPHQWLKTYPEQTVFYFSFGVVGLGILAYRVKEYRDGKDHKPFYRGYYDIVRPSDSVALEWKLPTDYPAPYLSNRENLAWDTFKKDYGYKAKI